MFRNSQNKTVNLDTYKLVCPLCGASIVRLKPLENMDVRCDQCEADLQICPKYQNLVVFMCVFVAFLRARFQHQSGPELVMTVCIMGGVFLCFLVLYW